MEEPPMLLDGARVLEYAVFDPGVKPSRRVSLVVGGVTLDMDSVRGLVIAENLVEGGVFLLHCNERWESLAAAYYGEAEAARESARLGYAGVEARWTRFRELSAKELAEVEVVRTHLREMAADPDE